MQEIHLQEKGATSVEFALIISFLLFFIFIGIDLLYLSYKALSLQYAASSVLRETVVGKPESSPAGYDHAHEMKVKIKEKAEAFGLKLENRQIRICPLSDPGCTSNNTSVAEDLILISIDYETTMLFMSDYTINAVAVGKNEPF